MLIEGKAVGYSIGRDSEGLHLYILTEIEKPWPSSESVVGQDVLIVEPGDVKGLRHYTDGELVNEVKRRSLSNEVLPDASTEEIVFEARRRATNQQGLLGIVTDSDLINETKRRGTIKELLEFVPSEAMIDAIVKRPDISFSITRAIGNEQLLKELQRRLDG